MSDYTHDDVRDSMRYDKLKSDLINGSVISDEDKAWMKSNAGRMVEMRKSGTFSDSQKAQALSDMKPDIEEREQRGWVAPTALGLAGEWTARTLAATPSLLTGPGAPAVVYGAGKAGDLFGTTAGYVVNDVISGRFPDVGEAYSAAQEDVATGVGFDVLGRGFSEVAQRTGAVDSAAKFLEPYVEPVKKSVMGVIDDAGDYWMKKIVGEPYVEPPADEIARIKEKLVKDPLRMTEDEMEVLSREAENAVPDVKLSPGDRGDQTFRDLEVTSMGSPFARHKNAYKQRIEANKQRVYEYLDEASIDARDAGEQVLLMLDESQAFIKARDAEIFESAVSPGWDDQGARNVVAGKMREVLKGVDPYDIAKTEKAKSGTVYRDMLIEYNDKMLALLDPEKYAKEYGRLPAPEMLEDFRSLVGDKLSEASRAGRSNEARQLRKLYGAVSETQGAFLPKSMQKEWASAKTRYAEYLENLPHVQKYLDGKRSIDQLVDDVSRGAKGTEVLETLEYFAKEIGREDIVNIISQSKLIEMVMKSKGSQSFRNTLDKLPRAVREKYGAENIALAAGLADLDDAVKQLAKDAKTPGSGLRRVSHKSMLGLLTNGFVAGELIDLYENGGRALWDRLTPQATAALVEIGKRISRQKLAESPYGYRSISNEQEKQDYINNLYQMGYAPPVGDPADHPTPLDTIIRQ